MSPSTEGTQGNTHSQDSARKRGSMPLWCSLAYLAFGVVWIFVTDRLLIWLDLPYERIDQLHTTKGWFFVLVSSVFLYLLLSLMQHRNEAALRALSEREAEIRRMNADLERRVEQRTEQLEAMNRELESFAYAVSHDLRAPLRSLSGFSQLLQETQHASLDEKSLHYLKRINDASNRMSTLIEDLLSLSRISRSELAPRPVDLSQLALDVAATMRERYPQHSVTLEVEPNMTVLGDHRLLKIAMDNLLDNAWKYTQYTQDPQVFVGSQHSGGSTEYFVRDNGVGFDMAYSSKLFGPFQRLHADPRYPGTGIGLVTVQRILARHGGRIWAQATPDQGATFYFTLESSA
jgi:light-regulated signal transduction histidine kinase (bacteriophytochrome)